MEGAVPAGYEEYLQGSRPKMAAPMMPDTDGATVYDFTFDKVCAPQAAGNSQHRHLELIALASAANFRAGTLLRWLLWHLLLLLAGLMLWRFWSELLPLLTPVLHWLSLGGPLR